MFLNDLYCQSSAEHKTLCVFRSVKKFEETQWIFRYISYKCEKWVGVKIWNDQNSERPIFRNFEISNIKITKVELFDFLIFGFIFYFYDCSNYSNTQNIYTIIYHQNRNFWNFDSFIKYFVKF